MTSNTENTAGSDCPSTPCSLFFDCETTPPPEVVEANAKLIAAAPELHKAAREMVRLLEWLRMDSYIRGYLMAEADALKQIEGAANCLLATIHCAHAVCADDRDQMPLPTRTLDSGNVIGMENGCETRPTSDTGSSILSAAPFPHDAERTCADD